METKKQIYMKDAICDKFSQFPHVLPPVRRIIAIGDIHGDMKYLIKLLTLSGVIRVMNGKIIWCGGDTHVVQVGDQIDSCRPTTIPCEQQNKFNDKAEDAKIIDFLNTLHKEAVKYHGAVISLLGNHELLNLDGDTTYVSNRNINASGGLDERVRDFSKNGYHGQKIICTRAPMVIIGSNLFIHAGVVQELETLYPTMKQALIDATKTNLNELTNKDIVELFIDKYYSGEIDNESLKQILNNDKFAYDKLREKNMNPRIIGNISGLKNKLLNCAERMKAYLISNQQIFSYDDYIGKNSVVIINTVIRKWLLGKINHEYLSKLNPINNIFWTRIFGQLAQKDNNPDICDKQLSKTLNFLGVNRMIIGHTPQLNTSAGISSACNDRVWRVDIGGAEVFDDFDKIYSESHGIEKMRQRIPQVLEITGDTNFKILYEQKAPKIYKKKSPFSNY